MGASMLTQREMIGWGLAAAGALCAVIAAALKGGLFETVSAAGVALTGLAGAWGYANKPASTTAPTNATAVMGQGGKGSAT